jgi:hypothetical protein
LTAVELSGGVFVLLNHCTVKTNSCKQTASSRVCEDFSSKLPIGGSFGVAAYRPCGDRGVRAQLELVGKQRLHAAVIHYDHYQVNSLSADLQANAAARCGQWRWSAPTRRRTASSHSAAMRSPYNEPALE